MALIPWRPLFDLNRFFEEEDWLLPVFSWSDLGKPAMDIKETDKELIAEVEAPGFDPERFDVSVKDGVLRVKGEIDEKKEEKEKGYLRREIRRGSFERSIRLPVPIKENEVEATYEKGVLKIVMPKAEAKPAKQVKIKVKKEK